MNFLLHILGLPHRSPLILRPNASQQARNLAASNLAGANLPGALAALQELATEDHGNVGDTLTRAHLHLAMNDYAEAETFFALGLDRIGQGDAPAFLERIIDGGEAALRQGHYERAMQAFQNARAAVDTILAAQAGLLVAQARQSENPDPRAAASLLPVARLGDLLLRMLARTHLAGSLATCLRERHLRHDLASWATSTGSVQNLLAAEFEQFSAHVRTSPGHAEFHYRLGLVARTLGDIRHAASAFARVVELHPHHLPAAARLAASLHELNDDAAILPALAVAFSMPPNVLQQYAALAQAAASDDAFNQTAEILGANAKPNLAFALSELGLLDDARAQWREVQPSESSL